jgi:hypothetical protein
MTFTIEQALTENLKISLKAAIAFIKAHNADTFEYLDFNAPDKNGLYSSRKIAHWLGY